MPNLPIFDLIIIIFYLLAMISIGIYFSKKKNSADQFSTASGNIPGWALGLSFYATFLSAITFLGDPGKSYSSNWNPFVFSLSIPFAAFVSTKFFVPFFRKSGEISAYSHLEKKFGAWARTYAMCCFVLTQLARMGTIFYGIALTIHALIGIEMSWVIILLGLSIILYTLLGGMKAVIWTEVVQAILKTIGALVILWILLKEVSFRQVIHSAAMQDKFSLGTFSLDFSSNSVWVVFFYGFFINLTNFGIDQNYIQRYHSAKNEKDAAKSVWLCALYYVPISAVFFLIGTILFVFYQTYPELLIPLKEQIALKKGLPLEQLSSTDIGDQVLPYFMKTQIPAGILGIILAALLSAAMSTISSGMNSASTVFLKDIYLRFINPNLDTKKQILVLKLGIVAIGCLGICFGIGMIGVKSLLESWWKLSGLFASGMLGIFLTGLLVKGVSSIQVLVSTIVGLLVVVGITFQNQWSETVLVDPKMGIVVGTFIIVSMSYLFSRSPKLFK